MVSQVGRDGGGNEGVGTVDHEAGHHQESDVAGVTAIVDLHVKGTNLENNRKKAQALKLCCDRLHCETFALFCLEKSANFMPKGAIF